MGENCSSVMVLQSRPKFCRMLPIGVRDNDKKYEPETQQWWPGRASQVPELHFQVCNLGLNLAFIGPKPPYNLLKTAK